MESRVLVFHRSYYRLRAFLSRTPKGRDLSSINPKGRCFLRGQTREAQVLRNLAKYLIRDGKKGRALRIVSRALNHLSYDGLGGARALALPKEQGFGPGAWVKNFVDRVRPDFQVRKVRVTARSTLRIPTLLSQGAREKLAIAWVIDAALKKKETSGKPLSRLLYDEIRAFSEDRWGKAATFYPTFLNADFVRLQDLHEALARSSLKRAPGQVVRKSLFSWHLSHAYATRRVRDRRTSSREAYDRKRNELHRVAIENRSAITHRWWSKKRGGNQRF